MAQCDAIHRISALPVISLSEDVFCMLDHVDTPVFVLEYDKSHDQIVYAAFNAAACKVANVSGNDIIGRTAKEIYPGRYGQIAYQHHLSVMTSRKSTAYELSLPLNGVIRHVKTTLSPILDDHGTVKWLMGTSREISSEYSLQEVELKTAALNVEMEKFIHLAAHDLRTPMRNVESIADELRDNFHDMGDGKLQLINLLERVARKAFHMIDDLLNHAHITGANKAVENFSVASLCQDILLTIDPAENHSVVIQPCSITGDKNATQIVLRNLVDNAFKHNNHQVTLTISVGRASDSCYEISIEDDGIGLPQSHIEFINGGRISFDGDGFGLHGIKRLILSRGGNMSAGKSSSGGALVKFSLPGFCSVDEESADHVRLRCCS